jgi:hypothetical protein
MGAIQKRARISGRNLETAFQVLMDEAEEEGGNDIYSGGWNNSTGVREVSHKEFDKVDENDNISKHEPAIAKCVRKPIGNKNKIKTVVTNFPVQGARKWETRYQAEITRPWSQVIVSETKQAEAIKKARAYVEKNPDVQLTLNIVKVLVGAKPKVAEINYKPTSNEADGEWDVFGCMSY